MEKLLVVWVDPIRPEFIEPKPDLHRNLGHVDQPEFDPNLNFSNSYLKIRVGFELRLSGRVTFARSRGRGRKKRESAKTS